MPLESTNAVYCIDIITKYCVYIRNKDCVWCVLLSIRIERLHEQKRLVRASSLRILLYTVQDEEVPEKRSSQRKNGGQILVSKRVWAVILLQANVLLSRTWDDTKRRRRAIRKRPKPADAELEHPPVLGRTYEAIHTLRIFIGEAPSWKVIF